MAVVVKQQTEQKKLVNPFCRPFVPVEDIDYSSQQFIYRVSNMNVDKETIIVSPVFEKVDLMAEIEAARDLCGVEHMQRLLASGLAKPEDFKAKPNEFYDLTGLPEDVHTASRIADMTNDELAKLARIIGIKESEELTPELFEERLTAYIKANWKQPEQSAGEVK